MERKIVQIAAAGTGNKVVLALCDDGTAWGASLVEKPMAWRKLSPIPQSAKLLKWDYQECNVIIRREVYTDGTCRNVLHSDVEPLS